MTALSEIVYVQGSSTYAAAIILGISAFSACYALSSMVCKYLESAARQPEVAPQLWGNLIISIAIVEAIPMMGAGVALYLLVLSPHVSKIVGLLPLLS